MFEAADNKETGIYLDALIRKNFRSVRQFGRACLNAAGQTATEEELRKMSNRLSQILHGKKSIQIHDLPIFTRLLHVSCEEILSAGKCFAPTANHQTNYSVALSQNQNEWEDYIRSEDQTILNSDEYGKTIIDYALEFENYNLLKYLLDNHYIWFIGPDEKEYMENFGAGTSIKKSFFTKDDYFLLDPGQNFNVLDVKLKMDHLLRSKMIVLAIKANDTEMLTDLHAREIPSLYQANYFACRLPDCESFRDNSLIAALADAGDQILKYFSEEFEITNLLGKSSRFLFPYFRELLDLLIRNENDFAVIFLKNAIAHNQYAFSQLSVKIKNTVQFYEKCGWLCGETTDQLKQIIVSEIIFHEDGSFISYRDPKTADGMITNIFHTNEESDNCLIGCLIQELNDLFHKIVSLREPENITL